MSVAESGSSRRRGLSRATIPTRIAEDLRERILSGEFVEGSQLRQEVLAEEYEVSRIPVREALRQLEAEGLIKVFPHRGAVVTELSPDEIEEVFELRRLIETDLLRRALPHLRPEHIAEAREQSEQFDRLLAAGGPELGRLGEMNWKLHAALYRPAERPRSMAILQNLHYHAERYVRLHVILAGGQQRAAAEHDTLIRLCEAGKSEEAVAWLERHIGEARREVLRLIRARRKEAARGSEERPR